MEPSIQSGAPVRHFVATTIAGEIVRYDDVWQREQLLLVVVAVTSGEPWGDFLRELETVRPRCRDLETRLVVTHDDVLDGGEAYACVADRWGEITHAAELRDAGKGVAPSVATLLVWVEAALHRCPECEGEAL